MRWSWSTPRAIQAAAPFIGLAVFLLLEEHSAETFLGQTEEYGVWQLLIVGQVIAWILLAGAGWQALTDLWRDLRDWQLQRSRRSTLLDVGLYLFFAYAMTVGLLALYRYVRDPGIEDPGTTRLYNNIVLLTVLAIAATLPWTTSLRLVQLSCSTEKSWGRIDGDVPRIRRLRDVSLSASAALAFIIAMAVLATGALRQALAAGLDVAVASNASADEITLLTPFPEIYVVFYGLLFSALLGAIYLHVFNALDGRAQATIDGAVRLTDPMSADRFSTVHKVRQELAAEMQIGGDIRKNLEGLLVVASPLIGALLSRLAGLEP
jgi:hypothetical protein